MQAINSGLTEKVVDRNHEKRFFAANTCRGKQMAHVVNSISADRKSIASSGARQPPPPERLSFAFPFLFPFALVGRLQEGSHLLLHLAKLSPLPK